MDYPVGNLTKKCVGCSCCDCVWVALTVSSYRLRVLCVLVTSPGRSSSYVSTGSLVPEAAESAREGVAKEMFVVL